LAAALEREPEATPERVQELTWQIRAASRQAVGYYDLTFSPAKSVSVFHDALMATGRTHDAKLVVAAHEAVAAAMSYVEREAGWSRVGYHGRTRDGRSVVE
jgi:TrwC relaxase